MVTGTEPATAPAARPRLVNGTALPASRGEDWRGAAPAEPLRLRIVMPARVTVAAARLTSLRLPDTRSPCLALARTLGLPCLSYSGEPARRRVIQSRFRNGAARRCSRVSTTRDDTRNGHQRTS